MQDYSINIERVNGIVVVSAFLQTTCDVQIEDAKLSMEEALEDSEVYKDYVIEDYQVIEIGEFTSITAVAK
jgi:hypothetical protein